MSKPVTHVPKHRQLPARTAAVRASRRVVRTTILLSAVAVATTGAAVAGGALQLSPQEADNANDLAAVTLPKVADAAGRPDAVADAASTERTPVVTRSDRRQVADPAKELALSVGDGKAIARTEDLSDEDPRLIAQALLGEFGFGQDQFGCLDSLWTRESGWRVDADNPGSSAYGIPQSLPGSKMASVGADWATNPVTQIRWGLGYIQDRYGSPCGAWAHSESHGFY